MPNKTVIVRDVELRWPQLTSPHSPFGTLQYDIQVVTNNEATKAQLESLGVAMKPSKDDETKFQANIKRKAVNAKGIENGPPIVLDENKEPLDSLKVNALGNGSRGNVKLYSYDYEFGGKKGIAAMLVAVQVTEYIEYMGSADTEDF